MTSRLLQVSSLSMLLLAAACSSDDDKTPEGSGTTTTTATATLEPKSDNATLGGTATFVKKGDGDVTLTLEVTGAPPGEHGAHIHETGDCSADDASSAGAHWNIDDSHQHGAPSATSHIGDLGNLTVDEDGTGTLTLTKSEWSIDTDEDTDVYEKAVVIHATVDDLETQPTGNSGGRIGCGVVSEVITEG